MNENIGNMFQADQVPGGPGSVCQQWQFPHLICLLPSKGRLPTSNWIFSVFSR